MREKRKHIFFTYWFYLLSVLIMSALALSLIIFLIGALYLTPENPTIKVLYIVLPISIVFFFILALVFLSKTLQWVEITDEGLKSRSVLLTFRFVEWSHVKKVYLERMDVSVPNAFKTGWIIVEDDILQTDDFRNGMNSKKTYIRIKDSRRARSVLAKYHKIEVN